MFRFGVGRKMALFRSKTFTHSKTGAQQVNINNIDIIPSVKDLFSKDDEPLRANVTCGAYADVDTYVDVHFRLLRRDLILSLREDVSKFLSTRNRKTTPSTCHNVRFDEESLARTKWVPQRASSCRCFYVKFKPIPRVDWTNCKRLMNGALVVLFGRDRKKLLIATVAQSDPCEVIS